MRSAVVTLSLSMIVSAASAAERLPTFPKGMQYADARRSLLSKGWQPVTMPDAALCEGDDRCENRPEMESCAGTGAGNCSFTWRRNGTLIAVGTIYERPVVAGVACRSGC